MRVRTSGPAAPLTCCTNLSVAAAKRYDQFAEVGDVCAAAPDAAALLMPSRDGYGDRKVSWTAGSAGGLLQ